MLARKVLLLAISTAVSLLLLECGARLHYRVLEGQAYPVEDVRAQLAPADDPDFVLAAPAGPDAAEAKDHVENKILHPFLGYVYDRTRSRSTNRFGFRGVDPTLPADADEVRVALLGGSVALQLWDGGKGPLSQALRQRVPAFAGKRIRLVALTLGGYKQPQQLMTLAWFLALGARFDLVLNLDGFNEIVLPYTDNVPERIHPAYPRSWQLYSMKSLDTGQLELLSRLRAIHAERNVWRRRLATGMAGRSVFLLRALKAIDARAATTAEETDARLRVALNEEGHSFQTTGPFEGFPHDRALFRELVRIWSRSSLQMHALCTGNGIPYLHFLQPNQYVADGKSFTTAELEKALQRGTRREAWVRDGYAALQREGRALTGEGVSFHDLSPLFRDVASTVYIDVCCHMNRFGNRLMADAITRVLGAEPEGEARADHTPPGGA